MKRTLAPVPKPRADSAVAQALADDLERIAIGAVGLTTRAFTLAARELDLTFPQWRALLVTGEDPSGMRISAVATRLGVTVPTTSRLVRRLERRGLFSLTVDEQDRRATRVALTARGLAARTAILANRRAALRDIAADLPDAAHVDLATGLRAIARALEPFT